MARGATTASRPHETAMLAFHHLLSWRSPVLVILALLLWPGAVRAQSVAVATPAASEGVPGGLAGAVSEIARQVVADAEGLSLVGAADLSITDLQLARGCIGETPECLRPIAADLSADVLLIPRIDSASGYVLTLLTYRATEDAITRVVRRGEEETLMDGLPAQVREALGLPPLEESVPDEPEEEVVVQDEVTPQPREGAGLGIGPWILSGAGLVALGVGVGLGAAATSAQSEYEETVVVTTSDADRARDAYDRASGMSLGANILFAAGGALVVGGVIWLVAAMLGGDDEAAEEEDELTVTPTASTSSFGVALQGRL